ncbi:hypothetical protein S40288_10996 [Stachybotrys chartarum IBT 40288]|nr:hypothetical protein S40288_10996 [Stachybotrys chartarum IBT 40288]
MFRLALDQSAANARALNYGEQPGTSTKRSMIVFSSAMRVVPRVTPERLEDLAMTAYNELQETIIQNNIGGSSRPKALTILHADGKLYVSSSARGASPPASWQANLSVDTRTEISTALDDLDSAIPGAGHDRRANCGEILALHQWHLDNPGSTFRELSMNGGVLATVGVERRNGKRVLVVKKPCEAVDPRYGCLKVVKTLDLMYLDGEDRHPQLRRSSPDITLYDHWQIALFPE